MSGAPELSSVEAHFHFFNELNRPMVGTPPNLIMYDFLSDFPNNPVNERNRPDENNFLVQVNFLSWMGYSVAQMLVNIIFIWVYLQVNTKMMVYLHVLIK